MPSDLSRVVADLIGAVDDPELGHAVGQTAKTIALDEAEADLGSDRAFSGFRRQVPLRAGYDIHPRRVVLNCYPEGLWILASEGRRAGGYVIPRRARRRRGRRTAVLTPRGPRYSARVGRTRPMGTLDRVEARIGSEIGDTIADTIAEALP